MQLYGIIYFFNHGILAHISINACVYPRETPTKKIKIMAICYNKSEKFISKTGGVTACGMSQGKVRNYKY